MPPTIPTSFVPRQPVSSAPSRPTRFNISGAFFVLALFILGLALAAAAGVFAYERYLSSQVLDKAAKLAQAQKSVSQTTVQEFVELQNRLSSAGGLLDTHITFSKFLALLQSLTLQHVEFLSLKLTVAPDHTAALDATGVAASFNALAAESKAFSADPQVKRAVFSNFVTQKEGGVSFNLTATIAPEVVASFSGTAATATSTPVVSASTTPPVAAPVVPTNVAAPTVPKTPAATGAPAKTPTPPALPTPPTTPK